MAIDNCRYTFSQLTAIVLPDYMSEMKRRIEKPTTMSKFGQTGVGVKTLLTEFKFFSDFSGCYVFIANKRPIYVGISRTVFQRLRQHVRGTTHFDATLAYRLACDAHPHNMTRADAMVNTEFQNHFSKAKDYISGLDVAFIEIENPVELYIFEAYCSMELDTCKLNTFQTH